MQHQQTERDQVRSQLERQVQWFTHIWFTHKFPSYFMVCFLVFYCLIVQLEEKVDEVGALELRIVAAETNAGEKEKLLVVLRSELCSLHVKTEHAESKVMATEQEVFLWMFDCTWILLKFVYRLRE